ncbi:MAG TPA: 2,3-bisphosphoglycerate-independent phosphoglycerate mutase [Alphaproteobacteria bacterium]|nr:2,3-bisphosphoglycerate-independent phosphoglycerate mutase [Alphaproteobacteria bacterium]
MLLNSDLLDQLAVKTEARLIFLVMDGLGGMEVPEKGGSELQVARTPNLDALAAQGICGLFDPVAPGITPGSGPGHFAIFGYHPVVFNIGRGVLSACGIDFPLTARDVAARVNFCTIDQQGIIVDRRAGRIDTETNLRLAEKLRQEIRLPEGVEFFFETEKDYRAVLILRGDDLSDQLADTDPQRVGMPPLDPQALDPAAKRTAEIIQSFLTQARQVLAGEPRANMLLLRGFAKLMPYKSLRERFQLSPLAIANYPMYRGIARLLGMEIHPVCPDIPSEFAALRANYEKYDFFFLHVKDTDSRGEDGDFDGKVRVLELVDSLIPQLTSLQPDVLVVTGDHSTPSALAGHSWHPVPVILSAKTVRRDLVTSFDERSCSLGGLGRQPMMNLMGLALAHAGRLQKFGA